MGILNKTLGEITKKELASLKKPLGVLGRPYPMKDSVFIEDSKGEQTLMQRLGVLESNRNPLLVYSELDYKVVLGLAMREMPTPSMLPLFFDALNRRRPGSKKNIQYLKGKAGAGKTYMSELIGRMRTQEGPMIVDCGDKNLSELLYETVLDFNSDRRFYDELDKRLANKTLNPVSLKILEGCLGEAYSQEDGKVSIDWNAVGHDLHDTEDGNLVHGTEAIGNALKGLEQVRKLEGLGELGGNALGMATQEGPLIVAWKEGREIVLDEYNKSKEGTDGGLQSVLQFLAGYINEHTVENSLKEKGDEAKQTFTFKREDQKPGFFVTLTGNAEEDGATTRELSQSVHSRVSPQVIPIGTVEDWQHRICQMLTGLPISTIYRSDEKAWKNNPDDFRKQLIKWRTVGLNEDERRNIPDIQFKMLRRWEDVMEASEKMARFYYGWSQIVDPESPAHRTGSLAQLMDEIDERYNSEVSIDFRKILDHISDAMENRPNVISAEDSGGYDTSIDWESTPDLPDREIYDDPSVDFGSRLVKVILNHINKTTIDIGKANLHRQLLQHAADCGLIQPALHEGVASKRKTISGLLDDNPFVSEIQEVRAELVRDLLCDYLRDIHPQINVSNEDLMTVQMVRNVLESLEDQESVDNPAQNSTKILVFNENLKDILNQPIREVDGLDATPASGEDTVRNVKASELLTDKALLTTLAAPALRTHNLKALWNKALSESGAVTSGNSNNEVIDQSLNVAQGESSTGLSITTLMLKKANDNRKATAIPYHVVWNQHNDHVLIVGEGDISDKLSSAFSNSNTSYVDRSEVDAKKRVSEHLSAIMGSKSEKNSTLLKNAFLMRNMLDSLREENKESLEGLLVRKDIKTYLPHFVTNMSAAPKPSAA